MCGDGTQTRTVACKDGNGDPLDSYMCLAAQPATSQACNNGPCNTSLYTSSGWRGLRKTYKVDLDTAALTEVSITSDSSAVLGSDGTSLLRLRFGSLEFINPTTPEVTSTLTLDTPFGEAGALVPYGTGYLASSYDGDLFSISSAGVITYISGMGFTTKALTWDAAGTGLYTCATRNATLRKVDPTNAATLSTVSMTSSLGSILGCHGLATRPGTGVTYILVRYGTASAARRLGTVDLTTGVVTDIGEVGNGFRSLAFL